MANPEIKIRQMTAADIPFGMELKKLASWNQLEGDWERLLALEPDGCFVATEGDVPVGTATTTTFEDKFGWIAMVLVHPDHRRKGFGGALLYACIEYLEECVETVKLDATPMGKKLYDTMGFVDEYMMERWLGRGSNTGVAAGVEALTETLLPDVSAFDEPVFGADRTRLLRHMLHEEANKCIVLRDGRQILGYGILRPGLHAWQLGPVVAARPSDANIIFRSLLAQAGNQHVQCDVLLPNRYILDMLREYGFEKQRYLIRMYKGKNSSPGHPEYVYAASGPEKG